MKSLSHLSTIVVFILFFVPPTLFGQSSDSGSKSIVASNSSEIIFYTCPMHPEIKSLNPGTCSKCGMDLEQKKATTVNKEQAKDSVYYTCSMHPEVKETKPGDCPKCGMKLIQKSINDKSSGKKMKKMNCMGMGGMDMK